MPRVAAILPTRVRYSSMVGVSSVPWMLKTAWTGSQNVTAAPKKFQSTWQMASIGISPTKKRTQMAHKPTRWTIIEVGLEDGMGLLQYAWFRHYKDRAT
ncbi:hypothetical protein CRG98_001097 [Punica granatum]|uniref:Uncharacterized protein n=1 Tax=Punica granatum TaxID=22663 RepID=A0A2I0LCU7_PUNGR|nr:hypothetical protein CRG98_001097 [Punica granatum]